MADDIVTRLRELMADLFYNPDCDDEGCGDCAWHRIGADAIVEIERLRCEVQAWRDAAEAYERGALGCGDELVREARRG